MMGIRAPPAADEARLLGDIFDVLSVANTTGCRQRECGFVDCRASEMPFTARTNSRLSLYRDFCRTHKIIQLRLESLLDVLSVGRAQGVFCRLPLLRP